MITIGTNSYPTYPSINGPGLPVAYDPLWRITTVNLRGR